ERFVPNVSSSQIQRTIGFRRFGQHTDHTGWDEIEDEATIRSGRSITEMTRSGVQRQRHSRNRLPGTAQCDDLYFSILVRVGYDAAAHHQEQHERKVDAPLHPVTLLRLRKRPRWGTVPGTHLLWTLTLEASDLVQCRFPSTRAEERARRWGLSGIAEKD